jgi:hypothetical protein
MGPLRVTPCRPEALAASIRHTPTAPRQIHDELDAALLAAYGWQDLTEALLGAPPGSGAVAVLEETLLSCLVVLNAERAAEERRGLVRWLRPELQNPGGAAPSVGTAEPPAP